MHLVGNFPVIVLDQYVMGGMDGETSAKNAESFFDSFRLARLDHLARGKWLTAQMWARYLNNNDYISDYSLVGAVML